MEWSVRAAKRREWSERLRRFAEGDETVAEFCARERVSVPSFYQWRRKLRSSVDLQKVARPRTERPRLDASSFVPVQITPAAAVRMRLPNGVELWLPTGNSPLLTAAIQAAGCLSANDGGEAAC